MDWVIPIVTVPVVIAALVCALMWLFGWRPLTVRCLVCRRREWTEKDVVAREFARTLPRFECSHCGASLLPELMRHRFVTRLLTTRQLRAEEMALRLEAAEDTLRELRKK